MNGQQSLFQPDSSEEDEVLSFDLETQKTFHEVGGHQNTEELKLSVGVIRNEETDEFEVFREDEAEELADRLYSAKLVIGYNVIDFDYRVLKPYTPLDFAEVDTLDMMKSIEEVLNQRIRLDDVASATVDASKSADGLQAVRWYKEGKIDQIADYCREDVRITSKVYRFGKEHGYVRIPRHEGVQDVSVDW
jgi:DEAD/DEAH box helicase domain-containing protein